MAFEMTVKAAWEIVREDMGKLYELATPVFSRPCLTFLHLMGSMFIFGQIVILTIMFLFLVKIVVRKLGYPVRETMHKIYLFMGLCSVAQICLSSFIIIISLQNVLVLLFVASVLIFSIRQETRVRLLVPKPSMLPPSGLKRNSLKRRRRFKN